MLSQAKPPFRAEHIGSLLRPLPRGRRSAPERPGVGQFVGGLARLGGGLQYRHLRRRLLLRDGRGSACQQQDDNQTSGARSHAISVS